MAVNPLVMHVEMLLEEASAEAALRNIAPKILGSRITFTTHAFQGKQDLLAKLPARLRGCRDWLPDDSLIVVLIDRDDSDCIKLKKQLEDAAVRGGLLTKTASLIGQRFQVMNRLCIEELEAWFFEDAQAVATAYPRFPTDLARKARFRDPDATTGGTWKAFERVLQKAGYYKNGLEKTRAARDISRHMNIEHNSSKSF